MRCRSSCAAAARLLRAEERPLTVQRSQKYMKTWGSVPKWDIYLAGGRHGANARNQTAREGCWLGGRPETGTQPLWWKCYYQLFKTSRYCARMMQLAYPLMFLLGNPTANTRFPWLRVDRLEFEYTIAAWGTHGYESGLEGRLSHQFELWTAAVISPTP